MEEKYCKNCLHARTPDSLRILGKNEIQCTLDGYRYLKNMPACDSWASACVDEAHEEKAFDVTQLKPSSKRYILCNIDNKTGEGHLVVKLDFKFKTKTMLPDAIYSMTLQELLDMEDKENE